MTIAKQINENLIINFQSLIFFEKKYANNGIANSEYDKFPEA